MKECSLETGFLFHTPAGPFNFFFHQVYRPNIFIYNKNKTKKPSKTHAHIYKLVRPLSRTMIIHHGALGIFNSINKVK